MMNIHNQYVKASIFKAKFMLPLLAKVKQKFAFDSSQKSELSLSH